MHMEYTSFLLCLLHSPEKPCKPKKLNEQKILEFFFASFYKVFTPLEMMRRCSAVGSGPRIIPTEFDPPLEFLTGFTSLERR
jgi:hypothetical protein